MFIPLSKCGLISLDAIYLGCPHIGLLILLWRLSRQYSINSFSPLRDHWLPVPSYIVRFSLRSNCKLSQQASGLLRYDITYHLRPCLCLYPPEYQPRPRSGFVLHLLLPRPVRSRRRHRSSSRRLGSPQWEQHLYPTSGLPQRHQWFVRVMYNVANNMTIRYIAHIISYHLNILYIVSLGPCITSYR